MKQNKSEKQKKVESFWSKFKQNKLGLVGLYIFLFMVIISVFAPLIAPYNPYATINATRDDVMAPPSGEHWFGQDEAGRDVLSLVIYGARISLVVGFAAAIITVVLGCIIGLSAGYAGGWLDTLLMRITDGFLAIPKLPLMLVIIAVSGKSIINIVLVIGLLAWPFTARVIRAQVLSVKERTFILRARSIGLGHPAIVMRHIFPQVLPLIFASAILDISGAILTEAALSFLGLGDPTLVSWGSTLNNAFTRGAVTRGAWFYIAPPGIALVLITLSLALMGTAAQEIINPRLGSHHLFDERKIVSLLRRGIKPEVIINESK